MEYEEINANNYNFTSVNDLLKNQSDIYTDFTSQTDIFNSNVIANYDF